MSKFANYTMRLNLTGFIGSRVENVENADGVVERGIFIPIDDNALYEDPRTHHILCEAFVTAKTTYASDGKTHYIKQKVPVYHVSKLDELGYKVPTLGHLWMNTSYKPKFQNVKNDSFRVKINQD